jgi:hypothetical protein
MHKKESFASNEAFFVDKKASFGIFKPSVAPQYLNHLSIYPK